MNGSETFILLEGEKLHSWMPAFAGLTNMGANSYRHSGMFSALVPTLERGNPYLTADFVWGEGRVGKGMHSHAGAWEGEGNQAFYPQRV